MKNIPYSWIRMLNTVKMAVLPQGICRSSAIPIKTQGVFFFTEMVYQFIRFIWNYKGFQTPNTILKKRTKLEDSSFPISKLATRAQ